jgi:hypothetical protein
MTTTIRTLILSSSAELGRLVLFWICMCPRWAGEDCCRSGSVNGPSWRWRCTPAVSEPVLKRTLHAKGVLFLGEEAFGRDECGHRKLDCIHVIRSWCARYETSHDCWCESLLNRPGSRMSRGFDIAEHWTKCEDGCCMLHI